MNGVGAQPLFSVKPRNAALVDAVQSVLGAHPDCALPVLGNRSERKVTQAIRKRVMSLWAVIAGALLHAGKPAADPQIASATDKQDPPQVVFRLFIMVEAPILPA